MLDSQGYRNTFRLFNTYYISTVTTVARKHLSVTSYVLCLSYSYSLSVPTSAGFSKYLEVFHNLFFRPISRIRTGFSPQRHRFETRTSIIYGGQSGTLTGFSPGIEIIYYQRSVALLLTSRNIETESLYRINVTHTRVGTLIVATIYLQLI